MKLVRIHPPNPRQGFHAQTYLLRGSEYPKFDYRRGWYEVDDQTAKRLGGLRNNPNDPYSRPVFQVVTPEEAEAMERVEEERVARASAPIPMPGKVARELARKARPASANPKREPAPKRERAMVAAADEEEPEEVTEDDLAMLDDESWEGFDPSEEESEEDDEGEEETEAPRFDPILGDLSRAVDTADLPDDEGEQEEEPAPAPKKATKKVAKTTAKKATKKTTKKTGSRKKATKKKTTKKTGSRKKATKKKTS